MASRKLAAPFAASGACYDRVPGRRQTRDTVLITESFDTVPAGVESPAGSILRACGRHRGASHCGGRTVRPATTLILGELHSHLLYLSSAANVAAEPAADPLRC